MMDSDQQRRLREDINHLATAIGERNLDHYSSIQKAAAFIEKSFSEAGLKSKRQEYEARGKVFANIEAEIRGGKSPQEIIIVGAHYDTARGSPGANDNASGVAALLTMAREFSNSKIHRTLRFVAFTNEERPFLRTDKMGSRVYARQCRQQGEKIEGMLGLETIGYRSDEKGSQRLSVFGLLLPRRGDFIAVVANKASKELQEKAKQSFQQHTDIGGETATLPTNFPGAWSSDHWAFWKEGYRASMLTDTAPLRYNFYHTPEDTPDKIRYEFLDRVVEGVKGLVSELVA